jgi:hypothetical protein
MSAIQVVKIDESILKYFEMIAGFQNESKEYREITIKEFKEELQKALNCGAANKEIEWVNK